LAPIPTETSPAVIETSLAATWAIPDCAKPTSADSGSLFAGRRLSSPPVWPWRNDTPPRALPHVSLALCVREADRTASGKDNVLGYRGASSAGRSISPAMHKTVLPYQPTKTHTTTCIPGHIASPNCRPPLPISSALSPRAKALARDASHPKVAMSGISWPDLEAGQSQPRAESLGPPPSTPRPSAHSWPRRPARQL